MTQEAQLKACPNAEAIAQQIADRTRWKKNTDTYARIYQAAYAAAILTEQTRIESGVVAELKGYVVTFCGPWAVQYSRDFGLPEGHLHPTHYDILEKCGARMDDFTRAKLEASK